MTKLVTDEDLARARRDPVFRQKLMAENLDRLLAALNHARSARSKNPETVRQVREGANLAVQLANRLHREDGGSGPQAA